MGSREKHSFSTAAARLGAGLLVAIIFFTLLEGSLRLAGYHGPSTYEDPYLGFESIYPLFGVKAQREGGALYATNTNKLKFFNYQEFTVPKPAGIFRIFCFGGSTTYGRPFAAQTAFPRWLEILMNDMDPARRYEVINAGGVSYASYRVVNLIEEALRYEPDLFIVYSGHNEFLERRTYRKIIERPEVIRWVDRGMSHLRFYDLLRQTVSSIRGKERPKGKPLLPEEVNTILEHSGGLDLYSRETIQKDETFAHYRNNLSRMVQIAASRDIPIVFVDLVSNIADFSPFKSEHSAGIGSEALLEWERLYRQGLDLFRKEDVDGAYHRFKEAYDIDSHYADLLYRMGKCDLSMGNIDEAMAYFQGARDEDVCPLRAPGHINDIIAEVGKKYNVPVVDVVRAFEDRNRELAGNPIPGKALFLDHLHPTIEGHQIIANQIVHTLLQLGVLDISPEWDPEETREKFDSVLNSLEASYFAEGNLNLGKVLLWARKTREAYVPLRVAAERLPGNADAHFTLGTCLSRIGKHEEAIKEFRRALEIDPDNTRARNNLALELRKTGEIDGAVREYRALLERHPDNLKALNNLGLIAYSMGELDAADSLFHSVLSIDGNNAEAYNNLGVVRVANGQYREAEVAFRKASNLRDNYLEALNNLIAVLLQEGKNNDAWSICKRALAASPASPELHNRMGEVMRAEGRYEEARREFTTALSLRPGWDSARKNLYSVQKP